MQTFCFLAVDATRQSAPITCCFDFPAVIDCNFESLVIIRSFFLKLLLSGHFTTTGKKIRQRNHFFEKKELHPGCKLPIVWLWMQKQTHLNPSVFGYSSVWPWSCCRHLLLSWGLGGSMPIHTLKNRLINLLELLAKGFIRLLPNITYYYRLSVILHNLMARPYFWRCHLLISLNIEKLRTNTKREASPYWLIFMVLQSTLHATRG